jgi:cilia- and flagella-associated protein 57
VQPALAVSLIRPFSKGFYISSSNGYMALWVRSEENNSTSGKQAFDFIRKWQPKGTKDLDILSLDVSPSEDFLAVALETNNLGLILTKSIGLNEDLNKEVKFSLVCKGFHSGPISALDIAVQRPLLLTCSKEDSTVRLWNYKTFACEMAREYYVLEDSSTRDTAKPLISVAIHPSGYYMAASFIDKIRFHHILHDEFKPYQSIDIRYCRLMKFSTGGHLFACVDNSQLHIFDSYTLEKLHSIDLAVPAKQVSQILFNERDSSIAVTGMHGYCGRWSLPSYSCLLETTPAAEGNEGSDLTHKSVDFVHLGEN